MIEIYIQGYVPRSPNAQTKSHWGRKMDERMWWEGAIARSLRMQGLDPRPRVKMWIEIDIEKPGKIKLRDEDNLNASIKHVLDAMVNLDLLVDDSPEWLETRRLHESNGHRCYGTRIRIGRAT